MGLPYSFGANANIITEFPYVIIQYHFKGHCCYWVGVVQWPLELASGSFTELTHSPFLPLLFMLVRWMRTANVYRLV